MHRRLGTLPDEVEGPAEVYHAMGIYGTWTKADYSESNSACKGPAETVSGGELHRPPPSKNSN